MHVAALDSRYMHGIEVTCTQDVAFELTLLTDSSYLSRCQATQDGGIAWDLGPPAPLLLETKAAQLLCTHLARLRPEVDDNHWMLRKTMHGVDQPFLTHSAKACPVPSLFHDRGAVSSPKMPGSFVGGRPKLGRCTHCNTPLKPSMSPSNSQQWKFR